MNIQILDSWLRENLKTKASPKQIAENLSLSSVSVEKLEKNGDDYLYDIEVTTNRPDLMSIVGLARETAAVLSQNKIEAKFVPLSVNQPKIVEDKEKISIKENSKIVNRVCAVIMEVSVKKSPKQIHDRLEATGIRSLNNLIDITNYVMRAMGHPTHVFDFDRIPTKTIVIRESRPNEKIKTLDGKEYTLTGGDIIADDGLGHIIDLLGVMGLENSVVTDQTKRILFFIDNNDPHKIRRTSMTHGIRTEAAVLNEKGIDPDLALDALRYGIQLYENYADGKVISEIIDIFPNKMIQNEILVNEEKINSVIGVPVPLQTSRTILESLAFEVKEENKKLLVKPPTFRTQDVEIEEDVIEEIARIYGYENIPDRIPSLKSQVPFNFSKNNFFFEDRTKDALKYWGFTECYTYPMVSQDLYEGPTESSVKIKNPLNEEFVYMRLSLVPSLLKVIQENKDHKEVMIFEIANVYEKNGNKLPKQIQKLAGIVKKQNVSFYEVKGFIEQLLQDLGVRDLIFRQAVGGNGAEILLGKEILGEIEILDTETIDFELSFEQIIKYASLKKTYKSISKFPPFIEDLAIIAPKTVSTGELIESIKEQNELISDVSLLDKYEETRTFHIVYQSSKKNLTAKEIEGIREKILKSLSNKFGARLKQ